MDIRTAFPHEFISAADLRGQDVALTIAEVKIEDLKSATGSDRKPVIRFKELEGRGEGRPTKMALNRTNAKTIAKALGTFETQEWIGKRITLYPTQCQAFGEFVDCIRVRETAPKANGKRRRQPEPAPEPEPLDDAPPPDDEYAEGAA